jgi:hypothetical protein
VRTYSEKRNAVLRRLFFALAFVPMMCVFPYLTWVNNPNENVRTYMTMAIVDDHTFRIDDVVARFGWVNDMARVPFPDGSFHYYSVKAPAISYAGVPAYWAFEQIANKLGHPLPGATSTMEERQWWLRSATWAVRLFAVQLPCWLFLVFFERWLRGVSSDAVLRLTAVAAAGLGTNYLAYTHMYASHALFAVAAFAGFALTERELRRSHGVAKRRRWWIALLAGWFIGWSVLLEYHALPVALVLAIFAAIVFRRPTRLLSLALGGLFHVGAMMFFQWRAYGNPFTPGHKMVENPRFAAEHHQGLFGILMPTWDNVRNLSASPAYGFFGTSPYMWLGLFAIPLTSLAFFWLVRPRVGRWRRLAVHRTWVIAMLALWMVNAGAIEWRAGWTVGPRYLGAAPPFFAFGAVFALEYFARKSPWHRAIARGAAGGLALASVLSIGLVGIIFDTLPETVTRPFLQFTLPLARAGFVPHHVLEWFGVTGIWPWYVAAGCLVGAPILATLCPMREGWKRFVARALVFAVALGVGLLPAASKQTDEEIAAFDLRGFVQNWEPQGRDRLSLARIDAERAGSRRPCLWVDVARLEQILGLKPEANRDASRAGSPTPQCKRRWL